MTGKQNGAMHEKDKAKGPRGGHFEAADNGGYMLTMHGDPGEPGMGAKSVHPSKKHMLKHMDAALPAEGAMPKTKTAGNLIKGPGKY